MTFRHRLFLSLALFCLPLALDAQPRGRVPPNMQTPDQLDAGEGERVLAQFRSVGPAGDLIFHFRLAHQPYRDAQVTYQGTLAGSWATGQPRTRVELPDGQQRPPYRLLQWNGFEPHFWAADFSGEGEPTVEELTGQALFEPLIANVTFSPFELQMPFVYWTDYVYEGTKRVKGRPAHFFLLYPPGDSPAYERFGAVRAVIDADFNVILQAELLDPEGALLKTMKVQSFKKVSGQWIVKRIDVVDAVSRDRTIFEVTAAAVGLELPGRWFIPESLSETFRSEHDLERL